MREKIKIKLRGKEYKEVDRGSKVIDILNGEKGPGAALVSIVDGEITELNTPIYSDANIVPLMINDRIGFSVYARSLSFLFILAVKELLDGVEVVMDHAINNELFGFLEYEREVTQEDMERVKQRMLEIVKSDDEIEKVNMSKEEAEAIFERYGADDKLSLLKHALQDRISIYRCRGIYDYFYGQMAPSTGYLGVFDIKYLKPGFVIMLPDKKEIDSIPPFKELLKLRAVYRETKEWAKILGVFNVGSINKAVKTGVIKEMILVGEGLHERKIARIADDIYANRHEKKIVLIAGPSSSGKTTFSKRLSIQLRVLGLRPYNISADDYFVGRDDTPTDEKGNYDFESIRAVDTELLNSDLKKLENGERVQMPDFNFLTGEREYRGRNFKMEEDTIIIIEGIHGMNEEMTHSIPKSHKYKVYVSALTQLNLDNHNSLYVSDVRTLRRIIRDNRSRGSDAENTLLTWPSVRAGEEKNIFPYQEEADTMFNSTIFYEMSVLKRYAEPLLEKIGKDSPAYTEASRMLRILRYFEELSEGYIPDNSIIREFIGGSCFE